jgi:hypothetical protein
MDHWKKVLKKFLKEKKLIDNILTFNISDLNHIKKGVEPNCKNQ